MTGIFVLDPETSYVARVDIHALYYSGIWSIVLRTNDMFDFIIIQFDLHYTTWFIQLNEVA